MESNQNLVICNSVRISVLIPAKTNTQSTNNTLMLLLDEDRFKKVI